MPKGILVNWYKRPPASKAVYCMFLQDIKPAVASVDHFIESWFNLKKVVHHNITSPGPALPRSSHILSTQEPKLHYQITSAKKHIYTL